MPGTQLERRERNEQVREANHETVTLPKLDWIEHTFQAGLHSSSKWSQLLPAAQLEWVNGDERVLHNKAWKCHFSKTRWNGGHLFLSSKHEKGRWKSRPICNTSSGRSLFAYQRHWKPRQQLESGIAGSRRECKRKRSSERGGRIWTTNPLIRSPTPYQLSHRDEGASLPQKIERTFSRHFPLFPSRDSARSLPFKGIGILGSNVKTRHPGSGRKCERENWWEIWTTDPSTRGPTSYQLSHWDEGARSPEKID